jgi:hypothetical protein
MHNHAISVDLCREIRFPVGSTARTKKTFHRAESLTLSPRSCHAPLCTPLPLFLMCLVFTALCTRALAFWRS